MMTIDYDIPNEIETNNVINEYNLFKPKINKQIINKNKYYSRNVPSKYLQYNYPTNGIDDYYIAIDEIYNESDFINNTSIIIHQYGNSVNKIICQQINDTGNIIHQTSSIFVNGNKVNCSEIDEQGNETHTLVYKSGQIYSGETIGYKFLLLNKVPVICILGIGNKVDTHDHIKYRCNNAQVLDLFVPLCGNCTHEKCNLKTFIFSDKDKVFKCSKHCFPLDITFCPFIHVTEAYSYYDRTFKYIRGEQVFPQNGLFIKNNISCGIGIHYCKDPITLMNYQSDNDGYIKNIHNGYNENLINNIKQFIIEIPNIKEKID